MINLFKFKKGQTMILTVVIITSSILGIALVAGMLIVFQIRSSGDFANTNKAIFAADAGTEWWLYNYYKNPNILSSTIPFSNGASFEVFEQSPNQARIVGMAGKSKRAFFVEAFDAGGGNCKYDLVLLFSITDTPGLSSNFLNYKDALKSFTDSVIALTGGETHIAVSPFSNHISGPIPVFYAPFLDGSSSSIRSTIDSIDIDNGNPNNDLAEGIEEGAVDSVLSSIPVADRDDSEYPDLILIINDRLPNEEGTNAQAQIFGENESQSAKDEGIRIMANIINPSSILTVENYYKNRIVSDENLDYSSSLDYGPDFSNKLLTETLSGICS